MNLNLQLRVKVFELFLTFFKDIEMRIFYIRANSNYNIDYKLRNLDI
jgi:hypothetical protein